MTIRVECPNCGAAFKAPAAAAGRQAKCRKCGEAFTLREVAEVYALAAGSPARRTPPVTAERDKEAIREVIKAASYRWTDMRPLFLMYGALALLCLCGFAIIAGWFGSGVQELTVRIKGAPLIALAGAVAGVGKSERECRKEMRERAGDRAVQHLLAGATGEVAVERLTWLLDWSVPWRVRDAAVRRRNQLEPHRNWRLGFFGHAYQRAEHKRPSYLALAGGLLSVVPVVGLLLSVAGAVSIGISRGKRSGTVAATLGIIIGIGSTFIGLLHFLGLANFAF